MEFDKNLKVALYDPDSNDEFLFGIEFSENKIIFSCNDDPSPGFKNTFEKFGTSLNFVFQILYSEYKKENV